MGLFYFNTLWIFLLICFEKMTYAMDCQNLFMNLQKKINVGENDPADTILSSLVAGKDVQLNVTTSSPLNNYFEFVTISNSTKHLVLKKAIDVETVFSEKQTKFEVQLGISCMSNTDSNTTMILITVEDMDDNGPVFNLTTSGSCLLPVLTASVTDDFIGRIETTPSCLCARDGDIFINNNITYSIIHGDPIEYQNYFVIDSFDGAINKTANISSSESSIFIFVIQAEEDSILRRNKVAVVRVSVHKVTESVYKEMHQANSTVLLVLRILSAVVLVGFTVGFAILIRHRNTIVKPGEEKPDKEIKQKHKKDTKKVEEIHECSDVKTEWRLETIEEESDLTVL